MCFSTTYTVKSEAKRRMAFPGVVKPWSLPMQGSSPLHPTQQIPLWNHAGSSTISTNVHNTTATARLHRCSPLFSQDSLLTDTQPPNSPGLTPVEVTSTLTTSANESSAVSVSVTSTINRENNPTNVSPLNTVKKAKRIRRKRCLKCEGCLRKHNCGVCSVCTNPNATNSVCKMKRCDALKRRPSSVTSTCTSPALPMPPHPGMFGAPVVPQSFIGANGVEGMEHPPTMTPPLLLGMNGINYSSPISSSPLKEEAPEFKVQLPERKRKRNTNHAYKPAVKEPPPCGCPGSDEGIYYTHLGTGSSPENLRETLEKRFSVNGKEMRMLEISYTGIEAKTIDGCPTAEWVIRRKSEEELFLVLYRHHKGHTCDTCYTVVTVALWEGLSKARSLELYRHLTNLLPNYGFPTGRRCEKNETKTCACQGKDEETRGFSYSFGCSWSVYYNGCKFARSKVPRKFKLQDQSLEEDLGNTVQALATDLAPVYKWLAPEAYQNQVDTQQEGQECRLGAGEERPFSGVTCCMDFCAHSHYDRHNMYNGGATVVCTILKKGVLNQEDNPDNSQEQLHVLPLYRLKDAPKESVPGIEVRPVEDDSHRVPQEFTKPTLKPLGNMVKGEGRPEARLNGLTHSHLQTQYPPFTSATLSTTPTPPFSNSQVNSHSVVSSISAPTATTTTQQSSLQQQQQQQQQQQHQQLQQQQQQQHQPSGQPLHSSSASVAAYGQPINTAPPPPVARNLTHTFMQSSKDADTTTKQLPPLSNNLNGFHHRNGFSTKLNGVTHMHPQLFLQQQQQHKYRQHETKPDNGLTPLTARTFNGFSLAPRLHDGEGNTSSTESDSDCYTHSPTPSQLSPTVTPPRPPSGPLPSSSNSSTPESQDSVSHNKHSVVEIKTERPETNGRFLNDFASHHPLPPYFHNRSTPFNGNTSTHQLQRSLSFSSPSQEEQPKVLDNLGTTIRTSTPSTPPSDNVPVPTTTEAEEEKVSDRIHAIPGGVALALSHGSILVECARKELHATTPIKDPCRRMPTRISLVFYQHKKMTRRYHGWYEEEEKARKRQEEQARQKMLKSEEDIFRGRLLQFNPPDVLNHPRFRDDLLQPGSSNSTDFDESFETCSDCSDTFEPPYHSFDDEGEPSEELNVVVGTVPRAVKFSQLEQPFYLELPIKKEPAFEQKPAIPVLPTEKLPCQYISVPTNSTPTLSVSACKPKDVTSGNWTQWVEC